MKLIILAFLFCVSAHAQSFSEIAGEKSLNEFVELAEVPVIVAFTASWCKPCKSLKVKLAAIAEEYDESEVFIRWVDADKHKTLQKYLKGGYPTVRVFSGGSVESHYFVGDKPTQDIHDFIEDVIAR